MTTVPLHLLFNGKLLLYSLFCYVTSMVYLFASFVPKLLEWVSPFQQYFPTAADDEFGLNQYFSSLGTTLGLFILVGTTKGLSLYPEIQ